MRSEKTTTMRKFILLHAMLGIAMGAAAMSGGCASVPAGQSVVQRLAKVQLQNDLEFWHSLNDRPITSHDDAFHGLLMYLDGQDPAADYSQRVMVLKERSLLPQSFSAPANEAIERGTLAVVLCNALHLKGGLTMHLFGVSGRYALRELQYRKIYPDSSEHQVFSGAEFLGIMGRVEDFQEGDPANVPAKALYVGAPEIASPTLPTNDLEVLAYPAYLSTAAREFTLADPATNPATAEAGVKQSPLVLPDGPLKLVVTGVRGKAEYRKKTEDAWAKAEKDVELSEGAELRTSIKSAVQLQIRPDQTITVDRLGIIKMDRATLTSGKFVTSVSMPYGRTRYDIDAANREYDATVRSPNSTLGIRGTRVSLLDQRPFPPEAVSLTGTAQFRNLRRQLVAIGKKGQGKTKMVGGSTSAAAFALDEAVVDPITGRARTSSEQNLIASLLSRGAVFSFDREIGIPVVTGGTVPQSDAELLPTLPGQLDFVMRWTQPGSTAPFVNMDLAVNVPGTDQAIGGETILAAPGLVQTKTGGKLAFDHRGGKNGGIEVAHFDTANYPRDLYGVAALNESKTAAHVRIETFINGKRYDSENSLLGEEYKLINLTGAQLVDNGSGLGYEADVVPGNNLLLLFDIQDSSNGIAAAASAEAIKAKPAKPFVGPLPVVVIKGKKK